MTLPFHLPNPFHFSILSIQLKRTINLTHARLLLCNSHSTHAFSSHVLLHVFHNPRSKPGTQQPRTGPAPLQSELLQ